MPTMKDKITLESYQPTGNDWLHNLVMKAYRDMDEDNRGGVIKREQNVIHVRFTAKQPTRNRAKCH